jgi:hypothetical protein
MAPRLSITVDVGIQPDVTSYVLEFDRFRPFPREAEVECAVAISAAVARDEPDGDEARLRARAALSDVVEDTNATLCDASCLGATCDGEAVPLADVPITVKSAAVSLIREKWDAAGKVQGRSSAATS